MALVLDEGLTREVRLAATVEPSLVGADVRAAGAVPVSWPPGEGRTGRSGRTFELPPDPAWVLPRREFGRFDASTLFCVSSGLLEGRAMIGLVVLPDELCRGWTLFNWSER